MGSVRMPPAPRSDTWHFACQVHLPWQPAGPCLLCQPGRLAPPLCAGGPFTLMSRRVLGTNAHLAEAVAQILAGCKYAPDEPPPLPLP